VLNSDEFRRLVARRWLMSLALTAAMFFVYYGYILLIATNPTFMSQRIGDATTIGIPIGAAVIIAAWILTAVYIVWANRSYDPQVAALRTRLLRR
jgi:uncharacterized membrane protein (DUF485 family)